MLEFIKQTLSENYRPIIFSLLVSLSYLLTPYIHWLSTTEAVLSGMVFFLVATTLFLASLCDTLKAHIDKHESVAPRN